MSDAARSAILARLNGAPASAGTAPPEAGAPFGASSFADRLARLRTMMEAVHTEFVDADRESWPSVVRGLGFRRVLVGRKLREQLPDAVVYDRPVEEWKREFFETNYAGVTTTRGAIAATGSLILWPSADEPRLLSLVPPVHIALLERERIYDTFARVMRDEKWAEHMPPNALLISGPSKTADIEQTLAYGVHGPKRLVVVAIRR